jgi:hypothetical protein
MKGTAAASRRAEAARSSRCCCRSPRRRVMSRTTGRTANARSRRCARTARSSTETPTWTRPSSSSRWTRRLPTGRTCWCPIRWARRGVPKRASAAPGGDRSAVAGGEDRGGLGEPCLAADLGEARSGIRVMRERCERCGRLRDAAEVDVLPFARQFRQPTAGAACIGAVGPSSASSDASRTSGQCHPLRVRGRDRVRPHADLTILAKLACALARTRATARGVISESDGLRTAPCARKAWAAATSPATLRALPTRAVHPGCARTHRRGRSRVARPWALERGGRHRPLPHPLGACRFASRFASPPSSGSTSLRRSAHSSPAAAPRARVPAQTSGALSPLCVRGLDRVRLHA